MELKPVWILAALNIVTVTCFITGDLTCPGNGLEIEIDINGYEPRGFRFPMSGTFGFPASTTCKWKFNTQAGLRIVLGVTDITKDATDVITSRDTNEEILRAFIRRIGMKEGLDILSSTGNSISIQLDTDSSSNNEEMYIYVIAGIDSGTCPGTSTIPATDEYQIITSGNFPAKGIRFGDCEVTITADENKTISYEILFIHLNDLYEFDCPEILEVFDGSTLENKIFDTCNSFLPGRVSKLKSTNVGRTLDLLLYKDSPDQLGFVFQFKQEDVNECLESICKPKDTCFVPERLNEYECNGKDATYLEKRYLSCPNDGSEVVINVPEFEAQTFLFPPPESDGLPISSTCTWTFIGKEGSGFQIKAYDITFEGTDKLRIEDDNGGEIEAFTGPLSSNYQIRNRMSPGNSVKVTLTTDNQSSNLEKFKLSLISGRDSGTCPGSKTIQATDSFQTITSANFPDIVGINSECDITINADERTVIVFSIPFAGTLRYRNFCVDVFSLNAENESLFTCVPIQSAINSQTTGNSLRIKFTSSVGSSVNFGFAIKFKQKAIEKCLPGVCASNAECINTDGLFDCECIDGFVGNGFECNAIEKCLPGVCDSNAVCINTDGSFECECIDGFVGNGFECEAPTTVSTKMRKKILLPLYLVWSLGTTVSGAILLILLYKMADAPKADKW